MATTDEENKFENARKDIYTAHDKDPNKITVDGQEVAYETHYAQKMEKYLSQLAPEASEVLQLAICAQHLRRWEVPRSSYPMTKVGYHTWRTHLKRRQAQIAGTILSNYYSAKDTDRCMALIEKEGLKQGEEEVQTLEDVACLVFLDDQFTEFKEKHDEEKIVNILKKTWAKMSPEGRDIALRIPMTEECQLLVQKALSG